MYFTDQSGVIRVDTSGGGASPFARSSLRQERGLHFLRSSIKVEVHLPIIPFLETCMLEDLCRGRSVSASQQQR